MSWLRSESKAASKLGLLVAFIILAPAGWLYSLVRRLLGREQ